jgi:hypothetical protein
VLALPADAGGGGERLLHDRRGVDEDLDLFGGLGGEPAGDRLEPLLDEIVVVSAAGIDRDGRLVRTSEQGQRIVFGSVVEAKHDHRARLRPQRPRVAAAFRVRREPVHGAVEAAFEEAVEALGRTGDGVGGGDADRVETSLAGAGDEAGLEVVSHGERSITSSRTRRGAPMIRDPATCCDVSRATGSRLRAGTTLI